MPKPYFVGTGAPSPMICTGTWNLSASRNHEICHASDKEDSHYSTVHYCKVSGVILAGKGLELHNGPCSVTAVKRSPGSPRHAGLQKGGLSGS